MTRRPSLLTLVLLPGLLLSFTGLAGAQQPAPAAMADPLVVTTGEGLVEAVPDRAWVTVTAESRASNPREAQKRNADAMTPVQAKLRAAGIAADAIKTTAYELQYEFDFVDGRRVGRGYVARNSIEIRIDAVDRVGEVLEIAIGSGATAVGGIRFDLKERQTLEREALRLAVASARGKADAAAAGAGRTVDRIVRIEEQGSAAPPQVMRTFAMKAEASQSDTPAIAAGQIEIRAQVTVTASLK